MRRWPRSSDRCSTASPARWWTPSSSAPSRSMADASLRIVVVQSPGPRQVVQHAVALPAGATVGDALRQAGVDLPAGCEVGIWGRRATLTQVLRDGDRVELARPLRVDPKVARR